ncbi:MAG: hypothetical protein ABIH11_07515 [Candidatus Altiarchaeota archaeon]
MTDIGGKLRQAILTAAGAALYVGLVWVPILGPLMSGFFVGFLNGGGVKRSLSLGVTSGVMGFALLVLFLLRLDFSLSRTALVVASWILLLWNVVGVFLSGVGAVFGSLYSDVNDLLTPIYNGVSGRSRGLEYRICGICGLGNLMSRGECVECGGVFR